MRKTIGEFFKVIAKKDGAIMASISRGQNDTTTVCIKGEEKTKDINVGDYICFVGDYNATATADGKLIVEIIADSVYRTYENKYGSFYMYATTMSMQEPQVSQTGTTWGDAYYNDDNGNGTRYRLVFSQAPDAQIVGKNKPIKVWGSLSIDANQGKDGKWYVNHKVFVESVNRSSYPPRPANATPQGQVAQNAAPQGQVAQEPMPTDIPLEAFDFNEYDGDGLF